MPVTTTVQAESLQPGLAQPGEAQTLSLPLWFVAAISLVSLALGGVVWWLFKPARLDLIEPVLTAPE